MFKLICKLFIKNYEDVKEQSVREKYGSVFSLFSIFCNIVLVIIKLLIASITNSVSIKTDALNNLSDVGSNVATLFGFKLSSKHPDVDHPYGHGRMEYVSGMIVSFLILFMGLSALIEAFEKIFNPQQLLFSITAVIVLTISILIKLLMYFVNKKAGEAISSDTLLAAGQDSLNDLIMTSATLFTILIDKFFGYNLDAYMALIVSIFVLKSGIEIFHNVLSTILGQSPDKDLIKQIEEYILSNEKILGIHDLMLHDYGPSSKFMTLHAEVSAKEDILEIHDVIDNIEEGILKEFKILTTIHMDPVDSTNEELSKLKEEILTIVKSINNSYNIHDFRIVKGPTHTNLVFDLVLPAGEKKDHEDIRKELISLVREKNEKLRVVCKIEHSYTS